MKIDRNHFEFSRSSDRNHEIKGQMGTCRRKGKKVPKKIGLAPEQGKGIEYEFDMLVEINQEHYATVTKDRTSKFQDQFIEKPGKELGKQLIVWLNEGAPPPPKKNIEQQCHDSMVEICNILTGTSGSGERLFTDDEMQAGKNKLAVFPKNSPEARFTFINQVQEEQKAVLQKRIAFFTNAGTGTSSQEKQPSPLAKGSTEKETTPMNPGPVLTPGTTSKNGLGAAGGAIKNS